MKSEDIPYGNDFTLFIPCDKDVQGCLSIEMDSDSPHITITSTDDKGSAMVFIQSKSQALMVIAAMNSFIGRIDQEQSK